MSDTDFLLNQVDSEQDPLSYAVSIQHTAASVGFDWPEIQGVISKFHEELDELAQEITHAPDKKRLEDELGDVLFACCNLARHLDIDPVKALTGSNQKFYRRFNYVETCVSAAEKRFQDFSLEELDSFWEQAKLLENLNRED